MNLKDAFLCLSCEEVFSGAKCPVCASEHRFPIARWLNPDMSSPAYIDSVIEFQNEETHETQTLASSR